MGILKSTWQTGDTFAASDQNTVSDYVNDVGIVAQLAVTDFEPIPAVAPAADIPTVAWNTTSAYSGTNYQNYSPHTGLVTQIGGRGAWDSSQWRVPAVGSFSGLDFFVTGTTCEIVLINIAGAGGSNYPYWIWVNGAPATAAPATDNPTTSAAYYVVLTWSTSARRHVEFFAPDGVGAYWYGVRCNFSTLIEPAPRKPVIAFVGDSYWDSSTGFFNAFQAPPFLVSRMLGCECFSHSWGGTGYVVGSTNTYGSTTRVASVAGGNPQLILIQGSVNDDGQAGIGAAATAAYAAYATACPGTEIIVFGPQPSNGVDTLSVNRQSNIAAVQSAALAAPNVLAFHDEVGTAASIPAAYSSLTTYPDGSLVTYLGSVWQLSNAGSTILNTPPGNNPQWQLITWVYSGTGKVGTTTGDGNRDVFLLADGVHPSAGADSAFATRIANQVRIDLLL